MVDKLCSSKSKLASDPKYICNPKTGRWVLKEGKLGREILAIQPPKKVTPKQVTPTKKLPSEIPCWDLNYKKRCKNFCRVKNFEKRKGKCVKTRKPKDYLLYMDGIFVPIIGSKEDLEKIGFEEFPKEKCSSKSKFASNDKYICNPNTGRWILKTGKIGQTISPLKIKKPSKLFSPDDLSLDLKTGHVRNKPPLTVEMEKSELKDLQKSISDLEDISISFEGSYGIEEFPRKFGVTSFVNRVLRFISRNKNVCVPFPITFKLLGMNEEFYSAIWNSNKKELTFDIRSISRCLEMENRFIIVPLSLYFYYDKERSGHQNMILIDTKKKIIERYDPWDAETAEHYDPEFLDKKLRDYFNIHLPAYKFLDPSLTCPKFSFQIIEERQEKAVEQMAQLEKHLGVEVGFCVGWSLFYLNLRLKYPDADPKKLQELAIAKLEKGDMTKFIKNYVTYLSKL